MGRMGRDRWIGALPDWGAWDRSAAILIGAHGIDGLGRDWAKRQKSAFFGRFRMGAKKRPFFREDRTKKGI
jgi:hypothetical protein